MTDYFDITYWSILGAGSVVYTLPLIANTLLSEKIKTKEQLERIVAEEAAELGLNPANIRSKLITMKDEPIFPEARAISYNDGSAEVQITQHGLFPTRQTVRHEVYHLKNHRNRPKNKVLRILNSIFVEEVQAEWYAVRALWEKGK
jgi:hypothetical protein